MGGEGKGRERGEVYLYLWLSIEVSFSVLFPREPFASGLCSRFEVKLRTRRRTLRAEAELRMVAESYWCRAKSISCV